MYDCIFGWCTFRFLFTISRMMTNSHQKKKINLLYSCKTHTLSQCQAQVETFELIWKQLSILILERVPWVRLLAPSNSITIHFLSVRNFCISIALPRAPSLVGTLLTFYKVRGDISKCIDWLGRDYKIKQISQNILFMKFRYSVIFHLVQMLLW